MDFKKVIRKAATLLIAAAMLLPLAGIRASAADILSTYTDAKTIPLLVVIVSYDANGNGVNDFDAANPSKLFSDKTQPYYGEQWAQTTPSQHYEQYFGSDRYTVKNYFLEMTDGNITYAPIKFENAADLPCKDGVISVVINQLHPSAMDSSSAGYANFCRDTMAKAVKACDDYVDFKALDTNGDGVVGQMELGIVLLNAGPDHAYTQKYSGNVPAKANFAVHGTSQVVTVSIDGVTLRTQNNGGNMTNQGEYSTVGKLIPIGVPIHELAHNLGAEDLYDRNVNGTGTTEAGWPQPKYFSLQCNGNSCGGSAKPSYLDPYHRILLGWVDEQVVTDGTYNVYSTLSGKHNILRVNTPDPKEYFLIEVRYGEGFETALLGTGQGGIMVWHIDESILDTYFESGMACSSYADRATGKRHDPGIVPLFRTGWNAAKTRLTSSNPSDPCYYKSDDSSTSVINTSEYHSATNGVASLNSYPAGWTGGIFNLKVEVLSAPGQEMKVVITTGTDSAAPAVNTRISNLAETSLTLTGDIAFMNNNKIVKSGFYYSESEADVKNGTKVEAVYNAAEQLFTADITGLKKDTKYYCVAYVETEDGNTYFNDVTSFETSDGLSYLVYLIPNMAAGETPTEVTVEFGSTLGYSMRLVKSGYTFCGWYYDEEFTRYYDMGTMKNDSAPVTLYGKWVKSDSASTLMPNTSLKYLVFATELGDVYPEMIPRDKNGYVFAGWYWDIGFTQPVESGEKAAKSGTIKVYAKWNKEGEVTTPAETTAETTTAATTLTEAPVTTAEATTATPGIQTDVPAESTTGTGKSGGTDVPFIIVIVIAGIAVLAACAYLVYKFVILKNKNK